MECSGERKAAELIRECFQAQLGVTPQSVEVRAEGELLMVRVRGFLVLAERAIIDVPEHRPLVEQYYLRLLDQTSPLLKAAAREATGCDFLGVKIVPNLIEDECLFVVTLGVGTSPRAGPDSPEHGNPAGGMP